MMLSRVAASGVMVDHERNRLTYRCMTPDAQHRITLQWATAYSVVCQTAARLSHIGRHLVQHVQVTLVAPSQHSVPDAISIWWQAVKLIHSLFIPHMSQHHLSGTCWVYLNADSAKHHTMTLNTCLLHPGMCADRATALVTVLQNATTICILPDIEAWIHQSALAVKKCRPTCLCCV